MTTQTSEVNWKKLPGYREIDVDYFPPTLLYAPTGAGKTYLAASASKVPELCPVGLIGIDVSDATLVRKDDIDIDQIYIMDPGEYMRKKSLSNMWDACSQVLKGVRDLKPFPFRTLILDGLSVFQFYAEKRAIAQSPFHQGESVLLELTQQGDYRLAKDRMLPLLLDLIDLCRAKKVALFMTAQERLIILPQEGEPDANAPKEYKFAPALMPSLIQDLTGAVDVVGKMRVSGGSFFLETRRTRYRDAKDRSGILPESLKNPTARALVDALRKGGWRIQKDGLTAESAIEPTEIRSKESGEA